MLYLRELYIFYLNVFCDYLFVQLKYGSEVYDYFSRDMLLSRAVTRQALFFAKISAK